MLALEFTLSKVDMVNTGTSNPGPYNSSGKSGVLQMGDLLWFTSNRGGLDDRGTISTFDPSTQNFNIIYSFQSAEGFYPVSTPVLFDDKLFYTTTRGGTGDTGVLGYYDLIAGTTTTLWNGGSSSNTFNPRTPSGRPTITSSGGDDYAYFLTTNGGTGNGTTGAAYGTIQKTNIATGVSSTIHNFTSAGRQPFSSFAQVGTLLYFTTFVGGTTGEDYANGAGSLQALDTTTDQIVLVSAIPGGDGSTVFGSTTPIYDSSRNAMFVLTAGISTQPGGLLQFDLGAQTWITLWELEGAPTSTGPFPEGRFIYGDPILFEDALYFTTTAGGEYGGGTVNRYDLLTGDKDILFDLGVNTELGVNFGNNARGEMSLVWEDGKQVLYFFASSGGENGGNPSGKGTLLRLEVVPEPGPVSLLALAGLFRILSLRKRRGRE